MVTWLILVVMSVLGFVLAATVGTWLIFIAIVPWVLFYGGIVWTAYDLPGAWRIERLRERLD